MQSVKKPRSKLIRQASRWFVGFVAHSIARIHIIGRENIPEDPPFIAVGNHFGNFEPPMMILTLRKPIDFLASGDIPFEGHVAWGPWIYGYIPTKRLTSSPAALKASIRSLRNGNIIGLFPEGRADKNVVRPPKPGAAYLACTTGVPIVPMGFSGLDRILHCLLHGVRPHVFILIGPPVRYPGLNPGDPRKKEILHYLGIRMMKRVAALVDPDHRGNFTDDPSVKKWDELWGWKAHFNDFRLPRNVIDFRKMKNKDVPEEMIPHRKATEVLRSFFLKGQDL